MRLGRIMEKVMVVAALFCVFATFVAGFLINGRTSFAEGECSSEMAGEDEADGDVADGAGDAVASESCARQTIGGSQTGEYYVNIYDSGERLTVKSGSASVGEVLARAGVELDADDLVEPGLDEVINANNYFINIYRARPVMLKDGALERYFLTASYDFRTMARAAGVALYDGDELKPLKNTSFLEAGAMEVYEIIRNGGQMVTEEEEIPFPERTEKDFNLAPGTQEVRQLGEVGLKRRSYRVLYEAGKEVSREMIGEEVVREPVERVVAVGASKIEQKPLTMAMGRNRYTVTKSNGAVVERQETYYDLDMSGVMQIAARECGAESYYKVREDGVKVDAEGYVLVAAHLGRYPRCTVVETSLGLGRVYDTGSFARTNPEQFDLATDWTNRNGR